MGIFDKVKKTTIESRRYEEKLYEVALEEVEAGEVRKGLYAKAVAKADGDKEKADGIYLKLRVQAIMDDIESKQIDRRDNARVLKAVQVLEKENTAKEKQRVESDKNREEIREVACVRKLEFKGYKIVYKQSSNDYDVIDKKINIFHYCKDIKALCKFADTAPDSQTLKNKIKRNQSILKFIGWSVLGYVVLNSVIRNSDIFL